MSKRLNTLLVGVADTDGADPALAAAVEIARRTGATLHVLHAYPVPALFTLSPGLEMIDPAGPVQYGELVLRRLEFAVRDLFPDDGVVCHAEPGSAAAALQRTAAAVEADLVLVGATRHGRAGQVVLGTTARRVVRKSGIPVLVLRGTAAYRRRVLLATDLSAISAAAYETGLDLAEGLAGAEGFDARVLLVVWTGLLPSPLPQSAIERAAGEELAGFIADRAVRAYVVEPAVRCGDPHAEITAEAERWRADLVVLGTHSRPAVQRWVLGSVAETALRSLSCSTLVVPPGATEPADAETEAGEARVFVA